PEMPIDHERIHKNGWRQGSVFTVAHSSRILREYKKAPQLSEYVVRPDTRLIVTSHSCDVVAASHMERTCEVCPALPLPSSAGIEMYGAGRNPRRIRLPIVIDGHPVLHEMFAPHRFSIRRERLESIEPDKEVMIPESHVA